MTNKEINPVEVSGFAVPQDKKLRVAAEKERRKESPFELRARIAISGLGGTGKTALIKELGALCGLDISDNSLQVIKVGDRVRNWKKGQTGEDQLGFIPRSTDDDHRIDEFQKHLLFHPDPTYNAIIESRLIGVWAHVGKEEARKNNKPIHPIVSILLTGEETTRLERIFKRDREDKPELTKEKSDKQAKAKVEGDFENFKKAYQDILERFGNPFEKEAEGLYDIHIDTTEKSRDEVLEIVLGKLLELGAIVKKDKQTTLPASGQIFPLPN